LHSLSRRVVFVLLCLAILLASPANPAPEPPQASSPRLVRHVILVSVDGLMPITYMDPDAHGLKVPLLREMRQNGAYSPGVTGVLPTMTYPTHVSIITGTNPGTHGIASNRPLDIQNVTGGALRFYTEDIRVPTLWSAARARKLKTASIYWPVTMGLDADALVPEFWRGSGPSPEEQKLHRALVRPRGLLEEVARRFPGMWDYYTPPRMTDRASTDVAVHLMETLKPNLLTLHIFDVDHYQHSDGPLAGRGLAAIEEADRQLARLIEAAKKADTWQQTALVVVSDHGFQTYTKSLRVGILLREKGLITLNDRNQVTDWKAWADTGGGYAYIYLKDKNDEATKRAVLELFRPMAGRAGSGIRRMFTSEEIVSRGGDPEAFLYLEPEDGFSLNWNFTGTLLSEGNPRGQHGLPPDRDFIQASLLIYGPRIGAARLDGVKLIDVGPTVARLLGLRLDRAEGRVLDVPRK